MAFKIFSPAKKLLQVAARVKLNRPVVDNDQTVRFDANSQVKATKKVRIVSFGDAFDIQIPAWIPIGTRGFRVQGEGTELDCLGRRTGVYQVDSAIVSENNLRNSDIVTVDKPGKSTKVRGCKFKIGERLEPKPELFICNKYNMDFVDLHRFFADNFGQDDYSYKAAAPDEFTPPFKILDIQYGKNKDFIPNCPDKITNKKNYFYLLEGPIVDSYTINPKDRPSYETVPYPVWFPKGLIEDRFVLWQTNQKRQAA